ncbi:mechanosensitive ion channel [Thalassotalea sp. 1_MG-2023]|uniref:mechanosensitive ion channel family protein n=1 Tax=Thalassotalea sp. 1_MG-2023 TaxID=3062680 RepID=UPI0026E2728A|nr:mechanosensitive ion channel domain-containing protein [Thalassotalea sp. 1_MG-2023]MDO6425769.1 mechanosensitive ion channel [Thalassotalea sp. 1_MG-2023]
MDVILTNKWLLSAALILIVIPIKVVISRIIRRRYKRKGVDKRYVVNHLKNIINLLVLIALMMLWAAELQRFAFSIAAFVVAIVIATKEIIQCFIGFIYLSSSPPFRIGDWIQINDYTGEVTETDWAKVTLLEVNVSNYSYTGRSVFLPNAQLMLQPIKNLNYMKRYVNHSFSLVCDDASHLPSDIQEKLLANAVEYCAGFNDVAERYSTLIENRLEISIPGPEPSVKMSTTDIGKVSISFALFCPTQEATKIEQKLTKDFFALSLPTAKACEQSS